MSDLVKLTLIAPVTHEHALIESLLEMDPAMGAFTSAHVDGHGQSFGDASMEEQVSGRAARVMIVAVLPPTQAKSVVEHLNATLRAPHAAWWLEPVLDFGRFS